MANAFYIQEEWITDYKLSGNDLLIFARLASFTLNVGGYNGSIEWLGHSVGITRRTAVDCVARLEEQGLIERNKKITKCVFQPLTSGANSAQKCAKIAQSKKADFAQNSANSAQKRADFAPKYNKEIYTPLKGGVSIIEREAQNTTTDTTEFLFKSFQSKINSKQDHDCIAKLASVMTQEQAEVFVEYCIEKKTNLHLGIITQLQDELLRKACEWDALGRPRRAQKKPEQPPQPTPQMLPPQKTPENSANSAENSGFHLWYAQVIDAIKNHPKFAKKSRLKDYSIAMQVTEQFPTPCDIEEINEYLSKI